VQLDAHERIGARAAKGLINQLPAMVIRGHRRKGAKTVTVGLVEDDDATRSEVDGESSQRGCGVFLVHQHISTNDGIEWGSKGHFRGVTLLKGHIVEASLFGPLRCHLQGSGDAIGADHLPGCTDEFCGEEGDITGTTADIEHAHPSTDPGFYEVAPSDRYDETSLDSETLQLAL
jgi:hypothetical protein